jgi:hypothetical protein
MMLAAAMASVYMGPLSNRRSGGNSRQADPVEVVGSIGGKALHSPDSKPVVVASKEPGSGKSNSESSKPSEGVKPVASGTSPQEQPAKIQNSDHQHKPGNIAAANGKPAPAAASDDSGPVKAAGTADATGTQPVTATAKSGGVAGEAAGESKPAKTADASDATQTHPATAPAKAGEEAATAAATGKHESASDFGPAERSVGSGYTIKAVPSHGPEKIENFEVLAGLFEQQDDGSVLVDGKYVLRGEGTRMKPYIVRWNMLAATELDFDPSKGKRGIPERMAMLHDKFVRIEGYCAFPLMISSPREVLVMLNPWDGCCIGVPPTPYDSVEVKLREAVKGDARFASQASVEGRFLVKPYLVNNWLVSLYTVEEGKFKALDIGPGGEQ